jgi:penicillin-binding protein 2
VALDEGLISPSFGYPCGGRYYACGHGKPECTHKNAGHAANLTLAIANSCNSYFAHVYRMAVDNPKFGNVKDGYEKWKDYMNEFGLGIRLGVDLPSEDKGNIPDTVAYNKGYYYTPHFVKSIEKETKEDTILKHFRVKHEPLTHITDTAFNAVMRGMQQVTETGTAVGARIPGINMCAKTGTAQNFRVLRGKKIELEENSMFVAFAPREDPKIAICVVVENAGFGSTSAGPIASLLIEKYLNDTLRAESKKKVEELANKDLLPSILGVEQYIEDSIRAERWAKRFGDSTQLRKFLRKHTPSPKKDTVPPARTAFIKHDDMIVPEEIFKPKRSRA